MSDDSELLSRAIAQAATVLDGVSADVVGRPTPCEEWDVGALADHLVAAPGHFVALMSGEDVDWSAPTPHVEDGWGPAFRASGEELLGAWQAQEGGSSPADWQLAELAVHTWDLATALDHPLDDLDPEVAERGLAFMRANLDGDNRGGAFGPEQPVGADADPYTRIAAFAGRDVAL